jgi:hypothetical protein
MLLSWGVEGGITREQVTHTLCSSSGFWPLKVVTSCGVATVFRNAGSDLQILTTETTPLHCWTQYARATFAKNLQVWTPAHYCINYWSATVWIIRLKSAQLLYYNPWIYGFKIRSSWLQWSDIPMKCTYNWPMGCEVISAPTHRQ